MSASVDTSAAVDASGSFTINVNHGPASARSDSALCGDPTISKMDLNCLDLALANDTLPTIAQQLTGLGDVGTVMTIMGSTSTLTLAVLFLVTLWGSVRKSEPRRRRLLTWTTSMPVVVSSLALTTFLIPRAADMCDAIKQVHMPFLLMQFVDLSLVMEGGQSKLLKDLTEQETPMTLCLHPCCFLAFCFRNVSFDKKKLRLLKGLVYLMPLAQLVLNLLSFILEHAQVIQRVDLDWRYQCLVAVNIVCFFFGMWAFNILTLAISFKTNWSHYLFRAKLMSIFTVILKLQSFLLMVATGCGLIPCIRPLLSSTVVKKTIDAALTLTEAFLVGIAYYFLYQIETVATDNPSML